MNKKNELVKDLHEQITSGKAEVHTKTKKQKEEDVKALQHKKKRAFVGAPVLLAATMYKLEELQEMGAVKMKTKMLVGQTIKSMEHDLNTIFDGIQEKSTNSGSLVVDGATYIENALQDYLTNHTNIDED